MGSAFFKGRGGLSKPSTAMNMTARAYGASQYAAKAAGAASAKDLGAASALGKGGLKPLSKTAASNAPGPKKV
jgi:hypothetical protein